MFATYFDRLSALQKEKGTMLCVGIDPDLSKIPGGNMNGDFAYQVLTFCLKILKQTAEYAVVIKPNFAFFARYGLEDVLGLVIKTAQREYGLLVILDAKRGDIGNTAEAYAAESFIRYGADAVTVNPYMGRDTYLPYLDTKYEGKGIYLLCHTSNAGARDYQDLVLRDGTPLYLQVAKDAQRVCDEQGGLGKVGLVIGATSPSELAVVRGVLPHMPFLIPGVGAQGGEMEATVRAAKNSNGGFVINFSQGIIYAEDPEESARHMRDAIKELYHQPK